MDRFAALASEYASEHGFDAVIVDSSTIVVIVPGVQLHADGSKSEICEEYTCRTWQELRDACGY